MIKDNKDQLGKKIIMVDVREDNFLYTFVCKLFGKDDSKSTNQNIFIVNPKKLDVHLLTRSKNKIEESFDQGYECALSLEKSLRKFLSQN